MKNLLILILTLSSINCYSQSELKINEIILFDTINDSTIVMQSMLNDTMSCEETLLNIILVYMVQQKQLEKLIKINNELRKQIENYEKMEKLYQQYIELNKDKVKKMKKKMEEIKSEPIL